jgi:hypothetical protein
VSWVRSHWSCVLISTQAPKATSPSTAAYAALVLSPAVAGGSGETIVFR